MNQVQACFPLKNYKELSQVDFEGRAIFANAIRKNNSPSHFLRNKFGPCFLPLEERPAIWIVIEILPLIPESEVPP